MNTVAGVDGETNFGGFLTRKVPKSANKEEEVLFIMHVTVINGDGVHILNRVCNVHV